MSFQVCAIMLLGTTLGWQGFKADQFVKREGMYYTLKLKKHSCLCFSNKPKLLKWDKYVCKPDALTNFTSLGHYSISDFSKTTLL